MAQYRKKPVVIEAVQFNKLGDHPAVVGDPDSPTGYGIHTLEHTKTKHEVTLGDWIITGVKGEVYSCKPAIFQETYEAVTPPENPGQDALSQLRERLGEDHSNDGHQPI